MEEAIKNLLNVVVSLRWLPFLNNSFGLFNALVCQKKDMGTRKVFYFLKHSLLFIYSAIQA